ncbi:MAG TPA: DNA primase [Bryobacteraceae bacterium]
MDFVDQLKSQVRIEDVVGEYVKLRKSGPSRYMGLCPFHSEKTPSFTVHVVHQFYKCFSCGAGGDVVKFIMEKEGLSFWEALKQLAERYGIPLPKRSQYSDEDSRLRGSAFEMHDMAQEAFRANLEGAAGEAARTYLARRGVARETIAQFGLGYAEGSGRALVRMFGGRNFSSAQMEQSGLMGTRQDGSLYDRFRNRLMFPIHNESGKVIGFGGRALAADDEPKYLNSPETAIYKKSYVLYNLHRAKETIRKQDRVILVEGYMDAIGVTAAGVANVVASCGTSLTAPQVQAMKRHSARIAVNFDPDAPGANAAERSIGLLLEEGMQVRIVELDGGLDPDEYCRDRGATAYRQRLDEAKGYFYWLADRARAKHDVRSSDGVVAVLNALLPAVDKVTDPLERSAIANDLAAYIGVPQGMVLDSFRKAAASRREKPMERPKIALRHDERLLLNAILADETVSQEIVGELQQLDAIAGFASRRVFQAAYALVAAGGRLNFENLHARLEEADQNLLAEAVLEGEPDVTPGTVAAALKRVRRSGEETRSAELEARVNQAERSGNMDEAFRAMQEASERKRRAYLLARLQQAERDGNQAEALRLTAELEGCDRAARGRG